MKNLKIVTVYGEEIGSLELNDKGLELIRTEKRTPVIALKVVNKNEVVVRREKI